MHVLSMTLTYYFIGLSRGVYHQIQLVLFKKKKKNQSDLSGFFNNNNNNILLLLLFFFFRISYEFSTALYLDVTIVSS